MTNLRQTVLPVAAFAVSMLVLPYLLTNEYYVTTLTLACINAIIAVGLNLLMGFAGQISLGHGAFYGLSAYCTAILTTNYGISMELGLVASVVLVALIALLVGIPTLKLTGHYLAMGTLGFGIIIYIVFNESLELTGGPSGFVGIPRLKLFGYEFWTDISYFYLVAGVLAAVLLLSLNLIRSRFGRALMAIHTSEKAAMCLGVDITRYKLLVFVISAVYAAIAGFLYAHYLGFVAPGSFGFHYSVELIVMVVLGGMASVWGAVAGAFFLTMLPEFLRVFEDVETLLFGGILVLCMMFMPKGIVGGTGALLRLVRKKMRTVSNSGRQEAADTGGMDQTGGVLPNTSTVTSAVTSTTASTAVSTVASTVASTKTTTQTSPEESHDASRNDAPLKNQATKGGSNG